MKDADALQGLNRSRRETQIRGPVRRDAPRTGAPEDLVREYLRRASAMPSRPGGRAKPAG
jgi:hypothetical protein